MEALLINCFCILIMVILLLSIALQKIKSDKTALRFSLLVCIFIGFLATNFISDLIEGKPEYKVLAYIVNLLSFLFVDAVIIAFSYYLSTLMGKLKKKWELVLNPGAFFSYIRTIIVLVLAATDNLFYMDENGYYQERPLAIIPYFMSCAIMLMLIIVVINNRKYFTLKQTVVIIIYLLFPLPCIVAELFTGIYALTPISLTLSILLVYIMVQASIIESGRIRESLLEEISSTDLLTKLGNRRAYYNRFSTVEPQQDIGVLFCDINGLKYTNDNFGHAEGDKLIVKLSKLLTETFNSDDVFRISGDEFVVIVPDISKDDFNNKLELLKETIAANNSIAAYGSAFGTGCCIERLVAVAESEMYNTKREQYKNDLAINSRNAEI